MAAHLIGIEIRFDGVLHGLVVWKIATLFTIYLPSSALGSVTPANGSSISSAAKPLAQYAPSAVNEASGPA